MNSPTSDSFNDKLKLVKKMYHQGRHLEKQETEEKMHVYHTKSQYVSPNSSPKPNHSHKHHHHADSISNQSSPIRRQENQQIIKRRQIHHHYENTTSTPTSHVQTQNNRSITKKHHTHHSNTSTKEKNLLFINTGMQTKSSYIQSSTPVPKSRLRQKLNEDDDSIEIVVRKLLSTQPPKTDIRHHHVPSAFRETNHREDNYLSPARHYSQKKNEYYEMQNEPGSPYNIYKVKQERDSQNGLTMKKHHISSSSSKHTKSSLPSSPKSPNNINNFVVFELPPSNSNSPVDSPVNSNSRKKQPPPPIQVPGNNRYTQINHKVNNSEILSEDSWEHIITNHPETANTTLSPISQEKYQEDSLNQPLDPQANTYHKGYNNKKKEEGLPKLEKERPTKVIDLIQDESTDNDSFSDKLNMIEKQEIQRAKLEIQQEKQKNQEFDKLLDEAEETAKKDEKEEDQLEKKKIEDNIISIFENDSNEKYKEQDKKIIQAIQTTIHKNDESSTKTTITIEHKEGIILNIEEEEEEFNENNVNPNLLSISSSQREGEEEEQVIHLLNEEENINASNPLISSKLDNSSDKMKEEEEIENVLNQIEEGEKHENTQPSWVINDETISTNDFIQDTNEEEVKEKVNDTQIEIEYEFGVSNDNNDIIIDDDDVKLEIGDTNENKEENAQGKVDLNQSSLSSKDLISDQENQNSQESVNDGDKVNLVINDDFEEEEEENINLNVGQEEENKNEDIDNQVNSLPNDNNTEEKKLNESADQNKSALSLSTKSNEKIVLNQDDFEFSGDENQIQTIENKADLELSPKFDASAGQINLTQSESSTTVITTTTTTITSTTNIVTTSSANELREQITVDNQNSDIQIDENINQIKNEEEEGINLKEDMNVKVTVNGEEEEQKNDEIIEINDSFDDNENSQANVSEKVSSSNQELIEINDSFDDNVQEDIGINDQLDFINNEEEEDQFLRYEEDEEEEFIFGDNIAGENDFEVDANIDQNEEEEETFQQKIEIKEVTQNVTNTSVVSEGQINDSNNINNNDINGDEEEDEEAAVFSLSINDDEEEEEGQS